MIENIHALADKLPKGQTIRIKIEVDTNPPLGFKTETKYCLRPIPFSASVYAMPDLFAGKMHALLCRDWRGRVKGRDWYVPCYPGYSLGRKLDGTDFNSLANSLAFPSGIPRLFFSYSLTWLCGTPIAAASSF